jgi:hypothetical protein
MAGFIDVTDRKSLNSLLEALQPETPALWGKMNAQNMIEHWLKQLNTQMENELPISDFLQQCGQAKEGSCA